MKKKIYKIGIWGQFGDGGPIADGQAVRTTITTNELKKRYGDDNVLILNTNAWKKHPIKFFLDTINLLKKSENIQLTLKKIILRNTLLLSTRQTNENILLKKSGCLRQ